MSIHVLARTFFLFFIKGFYTLHDVAKSISWINMLPNE